MKLELTRDSVCAGDDGDAPHARSLVVPGRASLEAVLEAVLSSGYLPSIAGGLATWSVASRIPLAVIAQQWPAPRLFFRARAAFEGRGRAPEVLRLHFNYHAQQDPEIVLEVLARFHVAAADEHEGAE